MTKFHISGLTLGLPEVCSLSWWEVLDTLYQFSPLSSPASQGSSELELPVSVSAPHEPGPQSWRGELGT